MAFQGFKNVISAFRSRPLPLPSVFEVARKIKTLISQEDNAAAAARLAEALDEFPGHSSLEDMRHFLGQNRLQESMNELRAVVEEARRAYVRAARAFADTDNTEKAIEFISGAFRRFPESPELHQILGEIYLRRWLEDQTVEDGRLACECLERASALDATNRAARRYLAGFYARAGCFHHAADCLATLDGKGDEEETRYVRELSAWCVQRLDPEGIGTDEDLTRRLNAVWESRAFATDCRDWARPRPPAFGRSDMKNVMVPFVALEVVARRCVELPGVQAIVVQNAVRSQTIRAEGCASEPAALESAVRDVTDAAVESCRRMELGHTRRCDLKTTLGRLSLHVFADTWVALCFAPDVGQTQAATVAQQFLDHVAEKLGEIHEIHS